MKRKRRFMPSKIVGGVTLAGRCSVCQRPFEVATQALEFPGTADQELNALFQNHFCDEDSSRVPLRVVSEATENK